MITQTQTTPTGVLFADIDDTAGNGGKATTITGAPKQCSISAGMIVVNMAQSKNTVRVWNGTAWRNGAPSIMQMVAEHLVDMHNAKYCNCNAKCYCWYRSGDSSTSTA